MSLPIAFRSGDLECQSAFLLAPLEGVSDAGFRALCFQNGAGFTWTEMIRAKALARRNRSTLDLVDTFDESTPTGVQLMVTGAEELLRAVAVLEELATTTHPHFRNIRQIDLNFGCPSPDVIRIGAGPALLKRRAKLRAIFEALHAVRARGALSVRSVSAKIRLGLNAAEAEHKVYLPVVEMANDTLDHLTLHARHAKQRSRDRPSWAAIGEAKAHASIPIVGNGDVFTRKDAERMHAETGCDAFLVARAAVKDPWCFRELRGEPPCTLEDIDEAARVYAEVAERFHTKEKFRAFHADAFARLRAHRSGAAVDVEIPQNAHMR